MIFIQVENTYLTEPDAQKTLKLKKANPDNTYTQKVRQSVRVSTYNVQRHSLH